MKTLSKIALGMLIALSLGASCTNDVAPAAPSQTIKFSPIYGSGLLDR